MDLALWE
jgi:hypothetical protein